jgi:hypothetical protein
MVYNGGVPLLKDSQPYRSGTSFNTTSTGTYKSATRDFDLFGILRILKSNAHGKMTWHAAVIGILFKEME